jgi:hypothetical protein
MFDYFGSLYTTYYFTKAAGYNKATDSNNIHR